MKGVQVFHCEADGTVPEYSTRQKLEKKLTKLAFEHLIIFSDHDKTLQIWQWVSRAPGKPSACREYKFHGGQSAESILQKLQSITFPIGQDDSISVTGVTNKLRDAFDRDKVTKKFYDRFKVEHDSFFKFIHGIPEDNLHKWYASVMINRLMFIYFVQKKGFLDGNVNYLQVKLKESKKKDKNLFYREFLCPLFFKGFAQEKRSPETNKLLGKIPYLNGGLFLKHEIETLHGEDIQIPDSAFERLFSFFDDYEWHLDTRPIAKGNEINPDVLGYIFEKYINQKELGAYYTKEDITEYISKNTIIPCLFDFAKTKCKIAFSPEGGSASGGEGVHSVWKLLADTPDTYIYEPVRRGVIDGNGNSISEEKLPDFVQKGMHDPKARMFEKRYNLGEADFRGDHGAKLTLPAETWREYVDRRNRCLDIRQKLINGEIKDINELITYNLDIRQFAQDVIEACEGPDLLNAFWQGIKDVKILDPTVGSGAFLFAALNILEPLYEACFDRMEIFLAEWGEAGKKNHPNYFKEFSIVRENVEKHPNRKYFIYKSIIINNLYGVDILDEAVEICKLRLFLKLAAQVDPDSSKDNYGIEPLPDIDFNIRAGNTLVGYTSLEEVKKSAGDDFVKQAALPKIEESAEIAGTAFKQFQDMQTKRGMDPKDFQEAKKELQRRLEDLDGTLNKYLAEDYDLGLSSKSNEFKKWKESHRPFHWFVHFYEIIHRGGFDVVIGNPPFVEYAKVRTDYSIKNYQTATCGNLYAFTAERSFRLLRNEAGLSLIFPISMVCTQRMKPLQDILKQNAALVVVSNYAERPSKLFTGAEVLLTVPIIRVQKGKIARLFSTGLTKWSAEERLFLFQNLGFYQTPINSKKYIIPKISSNLEEAIVHKIGETKNLLGQSLIKRSKTPIYYRIGGGRYWKVFTNFQPKFVLNGHNSVSSRENYLPFADSSQRDAVISVLSSSLFFWNFVVTTNGRDLNPVDLNEFPFDPQKVSKNTIAALVDRCRILMDDYKKRSLLKEKVSSLTGEIVYQEFYPRLSKSIIDKIDTILAQHYGFTDEELDFIINYDIKYRMGADAGEEE